MLRTIYIIYIFIYTYIYTYIYIDVCIYTYIYTYIYIYTYHSSWNLNKWKKCSDFLFTSFAHCSTHVKFVTIILKTTKQNTWNCLGAQAISKAPSQSVNAKILSATKDVDPPKEI